MKERLFYLRLLIQREVNDLNTAICKDQLVNGEVPLTADQQASVDSIKTMNTAELILARSALAFVDEAIAGTIAVTPVSPLPSPPPPPAPAG